MLKVCVVGLGYIGLPTASLIANRGFFVHGVDINPDIVSKVNQGNPHICEPDLDVLVRAAVNSGNLKASLTPEPADIFILAVPTPLRDQYVPDISYIETAARNIAPHLTPKSLVILESTSPVGTTERVHHLLADLRNDLEEIDVAYCPERVLPGHILKELVDNDRIIGGVSPASTQKAVDFYKKIVNGKLLATDSRTAELTKLSENAFRDVNIAFANELSLVCDQLDINVWEVIGLANRHPRVNILQPGPGVGGHCIAVDPWFIVNSAPEYSALIRTAREVNSKKTQHILKQIRAATQKAEGSSVACLGLTFKANVDDLRGSPAMEIVENLSHDRSIDTLLVVEPYLQSLPDHLAGIPKLKLVDFETAVRNANVVALLVDHQAFMGLEKDALKNKILIDTRGIWER